MIVAEFRNMPAPRLKNFGYRGIQSYSLTLCCQDRKKQFLKEEVVSLALGGLLISVSKYQFLVWCYCFMPDHLHLVIEGSEKSDLKGFVRHFKQMSGFQFKNHSRTRLWQSSYFDHVLRKEEELLSVVRYVMENPVRAGLVKNYWEYPFSGSLVLKNLKDLQKDLILA